MIFQDDLYTVYSFVKNENSLTAEISLNPGHRIFEGHFPGNPVLPGVCIIQITKELLEQDTGRKLLMSSASTIKYIAFIVPGKNSSIKFSMTYSDAIEGVISCSCNVTAGETVFCRLKSEFMIQL